MGCSLLLLQALLAGPRVQAATLARVVLDPAREADGAGLGVGAAATYTQEVDACGVCNGDNSTCLGCDGAPNSGFFEDACGECLELDSPLFNNTCKDCAGVPNGLSTTDQCGLCLEPTDPRFDVSCVGCDGVAFSGKEEDECGVCDGAGCIGISGNVLSPETRSFCCDCKGQAFGEAIVNFCCTCVDYAAGNERPYYPPNSSPPENQTVALQLFESAADLYRNASDFVEGIQSVAANALQYEADTRITAAFRGAVDALLEAYARLAHPSADDGSMCWNDWFGDKNDTYYVAPRDICGVCGGDNSTCMGRDGALPIGYGGLLYDNCGICGGENRLIDVCGVCGGDNSTCRGCDGVPNSGKVFDACYGSDDPRMLTEARVLELREQYNPNDPTLEEPPGDDWFGMVGSGCSDPAAFRAACDAGLGGCCGCDGVPNSGKSRDACAATSKFAESDEAQHREHANLRVLLCDVALDLVARGEQVYNPNNAKPIVLERDVPNALCMLDQKVGVFQKEDLPMHFYNADSTSPWRHTKSLYRMSSESISQLGGLTRDMCGGCCGEQCIFEPGTKFMD